VLTTTRAVRRRLDLTSHVDEDVVLECLDLALQAPTGGDAQGWRWIIITEAAIKTRVRDLYVEALTEVSGGRRPGGARGSADRMLEGAWHVANHLDQVPVLVVACIRGGLTPASTPAQAASLYGSIYPAVWSLQLALRARGLASVMTTVHLARHREMAQLLGIPENVTQAALIPVAQLLGDELHPARRTPARRVAFRERWDGPWTTETDHPDGMDAPGADGGRAEQP
jgi:nitroreductase